MIRTTFPKYDSPEKAVADIMADGRERTVNDIRNALDRRGIADAAAQLHIAREGRDECFESRAVTAFDRKAAVKIDNMQVLGARLGKDQRLCGWIITVDRGARHIALSKAHNLTALQVNGREDDQGNHSRKRRSVASPKLWLFSG
jgi:hypothetical protein